MNLFIEHIDNEILRDKKRKAEGYSAERRGDRKSILFSYGQVEFERTYYKKASGGYEYLADTTVNSLLAFSKNFSYKNLTRTYPMSDVDFFPILL